MCVSEILTYGEFLIIIISIVLLCLKDSRLVNVLSITVFAIQFLIFVSLIASVFKPAATGGGAHCSESYECEKSSKEGVMDCKYLDDDNKEHIVQCPISDNYIDTTTTKKSTTRSTTITTSGMEG